jgi:protein TonB
MNLDDIVFESRNKDYGAYSIRKHYSDRVNRAAVLAVGFAALLLAIPTIFKSQKVIPEIAKPDRGTIFSPPPPIKIEQLTQTVATTVRRAVRDLPPRVTTVPDEVIPAEPVDQPAIGNEEGAVDGASTYTEGTDIAPVAVEPAIVEPPKVWINTEIMPSYKGGLEAMSRFLSSKIRYPSIARRTGVQGTVYVSFIIGPEGNIIKAEVVRGISKECDAEALRVISMMPAWNPGLQGGTPVMVRMVLPIKFQLNQ